MRRAMLGLVGLGVLAALWWAFRPSPVAVDLAQIALRALEVTVTEEGIAEIPEVYVLSAPIAGKLHRIDLHPGDWVTKGQAVAAIGPGAPALLDTRARAVALATEAAARSAVDLARAQVTQAEAALEFRLSEAQRAQALFDRAALSRHQLDAAILDQRTAEAALDSARATLAVRERELDSAIAVLNGADPLGTDSCCVAVTAPVSGQVLRVLTEDEQVVLPGTPILDMGDPAALAVVVDLLSRDAVRATPGAVAVISGWGGPDLQAVVDRIDPAASTRVSALGIDEQRVRVRLTLNDAENDRQGLGHGFRVLATIRLWQGQDVLTVPVGALFRDGSDWATFVVQDGRASLRRITLGERNDSLAQVTEGLSAGDRVILHPSDQIAEGTAVIESPE